MAPIRSSATFPIGKRDLIYRYSEKLDSWTTFEGQIQSSHFSQLVQRVSSVADLGPLEVEGRSVADLGPLEVEGPTELLLLGEDRTSLQLPPQNTTLAGLQRVLVGEGITVEIMGAQEISLLHGSCSCKGRVVFSPFEDLFCMPLLPVHISGPTSFIAYRTGNSGSSIEANLLLEDIAELNLNQCYPKYMPRELHCPINSPSSTVATMEKLLRRLLGESTRKSGIQFSSFVKANVKASTMVKFQEQLERDVREDDSVWAKAAESRNLRS